MMENLAAALDRVSTTIGEHTVALRRDINRHGDAQRKLSILLLAFLGLALLGIVANFLVVHQMREVQQASRTNGQVIRDCTIPTGKCYRDNMKRTGVLVAQLNEVNIIVGECSKETDTAEQLRACVNQRVAVATARAQAAAPKRS